MMAPLLEDNGDGQALAKSTNALVNLLRPTVIALI
jgi:hypothetical protein